MKKVDKVGPDWGLMLENKVGAHASSMPYRKLPSSTLMALIANASFNLVLAIMIVQRMHKWPNMSLPQIAQLYL